MNYIGSGSQTFPSSPWTAEAGGNWSNYNTSLVSPVAHQQQPIPSRISQSDHGMVSSEAINKANKNLSSPLIKTKHSGLHGKHQPHHSTPQQLQHQVKEFYFSTVINAYS